MPVAALLRVVDAFLAKYSDDQARDERGRWSSGSGEGIRADDGPAGRSLQDRGIPRGTAPIRDELTYLKDQLRGAGSDVVGVHLVGSWAAQDPDRPPDRRGQGTSDIDIKVEERPTSPGSDWSERAQSRDRVEALVTRVRESYGQKFKERGLDISVGPVAFSDTPAVTLLGDRIEKSVEKAPKPRRPAAAFRAAHRVVDPAADRLRGAIVRAVRSAKVDEAALGRAIRDRADGVGDAALDAIWADAADALAGAVAPGLLEVAAQSARAAARLVPGAVAKYSEDQARDESGRWTSGGGGESDGGGSVTATAGRDMPRERIERHMDAVETRVSEMEASRDDSPELRNPKSKDGKAFLAVLDELPDHVGTVYRGTTMSQKEYEKAAASRIWSMKLSSSTSKDEQVGKDFVGLAASVADPGDVVVLLEMRVSRGKDISAHVQEEWRDQKEVVVRGGTKFDRIDLPSVEQGTSGLADGSFRFVRIRLRERP